MKDLIARLTMESILYLIDLAGLSQMAITVGRKLDAWVLG